MENGQIQGTEGIIYSRKNDYYIVGKENGLFCNAAESKETLKGHVFIPLSYNGVPIKEIASYAFSDCYYITEVYIYARIEIIGTAAFDHCISLSLITIPSSVKIIKVYAVTCNKYHVNQDETPEGVLNIIFEPSSQLNYIQTSAFGYRDYIHVYLCGNMNTNIQYSEPIIIKGSYTVFSPYNEVSFCGIPLTQYMHPFCKYFNTELCTKVQFNIFWFKSLSLFYHIIIIL